MTPQTSTQDPEAQTYIFTPRELARLAVYRAAIVAGFYTDDCDPRRSAQLPRRQTLNS